MTRPACPDCDRWARLAGDKWWCPNCGQLVVSPVHEALRTFGRGVSAPRLITAGRPDPDALQLAAERLGLHDEARTIDTPAVRRRGRSRRDARDGGAAPASTAPPALTFEQEVLFS